MRYVIVILLLASSFAFGQTVEWDAANLSMEGVDLGAPYVRFMIDNTAELSDLTNVRMSVEIHSGSLGGITLLQAGDEDNPWEGQKPSLFTVDGTLWLSGYTMYPGSPMEIAPLYYGRRQPESPHFVPFDDSYLADKPDDYTQEEWDIFRRFEFEGEFNTVFIRGSIPAGWELDLIFKFNGLNGSRVEIFSTASGNVMSDQGTWELTDTDPRAIPEPGALALLAVGGVVRLFKRK